MAVYIGKYMNELKKSIRGSIQESISNLIDAKNKLDIIEKEQGKFLHEILARHKLDYIKDTDNYEW